MGCGDPLTSFDVATGVSCALQLTIERDILSVVLPYSPFDFQVDQTTLQDL